jgi:hypothetical protein
MDSLPSTDEPSEEREVKRMYKNNGDDYKTDGDFIFGD